MIEVLLKRRRNVEKVGNVERVGNVESRRSEEDKKEIRNVARGLYNKGLVTGAAVVFLSIGIGYGIVGDTKKGMVFGATSVIFGVVALATGNKSRNELLRNMEKKVESHKAIEESLRPSSVFDLGELKISLRMTESVHSNDNRMKPQTDK